MNIFHNKLSEAPFGIKLFTFLCLILMGYCLTLFIAIILTLLSGGDTLLRLTFATQDIFLFILPALCAAYMFAPAPWHYLQASRLPGITAVGMVVVCMIFSMPLMNFIIAWNEAIELPAALSHVEEWMRAQEAAAQAATTQLLDMSSVGDLCAMIAIVGILTGIGEEFVFRGVVQRLITEKWRNRHLAIWITAFLFSAIHLQFYGFVPRLLLGAFFGYLLVWSGNIWVPVVAHALNNSVAIVSAYIWGVEPAEGSAYIDEIGTNGEWGMVLVSLTITVALLAITRRTLTQGNRHFASSSEPQ